MEYPARRKDTANASPTFPAPTIAMRGFSAHARENSRVRFELAGSATPKTSGHALYLFPCRKPYALLRAGQSLATARHNERLV
jgi:hypothetical protein